MKVISWNLYKHNPHWRRVVTSLLASKADILCLQEVSAEVLQELEKSDNYNCFSAVDFSMEGEKIFLVIMVHHTLPVRTHKVSQHTKVFRKSLVAWVAGWKETVESQSILIDTEDGPIRIINCHLSIAVSMARRRKQLEEIMKAHHDDLPLILCGDLNTYGTPWRNFLFGLPLGLTISELLENELELLEELAKKHGLTAVFEDIVTHPLSGGHLDHILISAHFRVKQKELREERHGSDHHALIADLDFNDTGS